MPTVDDFLAGLDEATRSAFGRVRDVAMSEAPDAEQGTSYGMPALRWNGKPLLGFGVARNHLSLHPFSPASIDAVRDRLAGFDVSKGTVRFTVERPLPEDVVRDMVTHRMTEIVR